MTNTEKINIAKTVASTENCCGCSACENICPKNAITLKADCSGCLYPVIDEALCVYCGICKDKCPLQNSNDRKGHFEKPLSFAALSKNEEMRKGASSGGVFATLATKIIDNGGVVFGAAYDENNDVRHRLATNKAELEGLKSSKYVQSILGDTFRQVKTNLENGHKVMFTGTPCQVAGLKKYLGKLSEHSNLILCDIVCHGTPCPEYYRKHISELENRFNSRLKSVNFRAKKLRGQQQDIEYIFDNGKHYNEYADIDAYRSLFTRGYLLRQSCFECKFANTNREGDITLGDFWGVEKNNIDFASPKGTSLVLISTEKGKSFFDSVSSELYFKQTKLENSLQPNLKKPTAKPDDYESFIKYTEVNTLKSAAKKFAPSQLSTLLRLKRKLGNIIKR